ncbi:oligosaccharide flippase family protein [Acinetobacter sp. YH12245]|uniref:oligosaccharide flippase family protein n=1 Tax=Acinetobacter sp. YH12245 TaxID=2601171 RepID=UPI0015D3E497|nr:oligosaccharide flippase family protein [Acinetobacter sp. YH12245]
MSVKILLNNTLWSTINHLLSRGVLMLSGILLAKYFLPKEFAIYSYYQMTVVMISSYAALGLGVAASKFFAEFSINKNDKNIKNHISTLSGISVIMSLIVSFVIILLPNRLLDGGLDIPIYIFSISILLLGLNVIPNGAILGLEKYKEAAIISLINGFFCLAGVYLSIKYYNIYYSIYFFMIANFVQLIGLNFIINKNISDFNILERFLIKKKSIKDIFNFLGPLVLVSLLTAFSGWIIGRSLLEKYGEYIFSVYSIGLQWFALALFLPGMISRVVLPRLIRSNSNNTDSRRFLKISCIIALFFSLSILLFVYLFLETIINFYGEQYKEYKNIIILFLLIAVLYAPTNTLGNAIVAKLGSFSWFIITLIWFIILLMVFFINLREYGIMAVIYSQGASTIILLLSSYILCKKKGLL